MQDLSKRNTKVGFICPDYGTFYKLKCHNVSNTFTWCYGAGRCHLQQIFTHVKQ